MFVRCDLVFFKMKLKNMQNRLMGVYIKKTRGAVWPSGLRHPSSELRVRIPLVSMALHANYAVPRDSNWNGSF